ncbi:DNA-3-methyladenine glycosylase 2 family protein [Halorubellus sp. JP-L1]|uniref:DNA-3-methyladenine glycosylase family protein n=1 Tax=Halorubellus sp. JP-L1 TaxID=2715753 RepID=UPI0014084E65|nr:DNA-3-methyladenine glycosylase 2 family protein [Halorubellus sp. JP-L1]
MTNDSEATDAPEAVDDDPHPFLRADEYLGPAVAEHGELSVETAEDLFERLVVSILRQQVSMASAAATRERLFDAVDVTPDGIRAADDDVLRDVGLSRQKTRYVNAVAETFAERGYSVDHFADWDDDAVREALTSITGVGDWTANMQLLFALGREDVFPVGDLGVRKGMRRVFPDGDDLSRSEMVGRAERWKPYRSYATLYLWRIEEDVVDGVDEVVED